MVTEQTKVFVIVLNYNGGPDLERCLAGLLRLDYPRLEIVLVDNRSDDGSFEKAKELFPRLTFIQNSQNLGFAAGNNVGIKYALERDAQYVWLLNNDAEVEPNSLARLVEAVETEPKIGLASPLILGEDAAVWFSGGKLDWWRMKTYHETAPRAEAYFGSDYLSGCALLIRAEVFKKVGLLDEDYFLYWEDADFSWRTRRAGYKLAVLPAGRVRHRERSRSEQSRKTYWLVLSGLLFFKKNAAWWRRPWIVAYFMARKIKNMSDVKKAKGDLAPAVQKAYRDYKKTR